MKKVGLLLFIGLLCISLSSFAGEVITNDTGDDAIGLRVVFSEAVQITAFGDTLMEVDQTGPADEFVFSGGTVEAWGSHWLSYSPTTARVVEYEWLTVPLTGSSVPQHTQGALPKTQIIDHHIVLEPLSGKGNSLSLVLREVIPERIPLTVSYEILSSSISLDGAVFTWVVGDALSETPSALFVLLDEGPFSFRLDIAIGDGTYKWEREALVLPLHDNTTVVCDVAGFGVDPESVKSAAWSVRNWEMGEPAMMQLSQADSAVALLECTAPTFLDVECHVQYMNGRTEILVASATVFSRDGKDFESTGIGFFLTDPAASLDAVMKELPRTLSDLHCDHIAVGIIEWFGEPVNGEFRIHPLDALPSGQRSALGYTISDDELAAIVETARTAGFKVWIVLGATPYYTAGTWTNNYQGWAAGNNADFRLQRGFVEGRDGEGLRASFLRRLDFLVANQDVISMVYLGAEWQYELTMGGMRTATFYGLIVDEFRAAGYLGGISHASMTGSWDAGWFFERLVDPTRCGMPFREKMDSVGSTFYSRLLFEESEPFPGSAVLIERAREMTETLFSTIHRNYGMPVSIVDFYCLPSMNCLYSPEVWDISGPVNLDAFLQFHGTWLTALGEASHSAQNPWLSITVGLYRAIADSLYLRSRNNPFFATHAWVNADFPNNQDYRRLLAAFFGDYSFAEHTVVEEET